ncbi:MAG: linear amide C-N hydrolase [Deltaproteobacteria bacterium]|nr:linear amide C-N hydrolase [Deltaproteobacteria bacterium]
MRRVTAWLTVVLAAILWAGFFPPAHACSDIFINHSNARVEARSMDFGMNIAMGDTFGFIGQKNTTDVVIDAEKIPAKSLTSWTNKYGYWGRNAFNTAKVDDAMNTEGLSISGLYLDAYTQYPVYDPADGRPVLGVFDLPNFLISQAKNVDEAVGLIRGRQIVQSAVEIKQGIFLRNTPLHLSLRDRSGKSAVVEFVGGKTLIYENAGNVLTNSPTYPQQQEMVKKYAALNVEKDNSLTGMPGGFDSPERFARGHILTKVLPVPASTQEALYQADFVISSCSVPYFGRPGSGYRSNTIWRVLKDLGNGVVYTQNAVYFQGGGKIAPSHVANNGYTIIDLKTIDFKKIPMDFIGSTIEPTPQNRVLKIMRANDIPEFGE